MSLKEEVNYVELNNYNSNIATINGRSRSDCYPPLAILYSGYMVNHIYNTATRGLNLAGECEK